MKTRVAVLHSTLFAAIAATALAVPAHAAESYDNCAGTIASLPAVITTQGVWCMKGDLSSAIASGDAITVAVNNVTIDCNHFKLGGLAAGPETLANGIRGTASNTTVRNCNVRGFLQGIFLDSSGNGGHLVEDNRAEANTLHGIRVYGDNSVVRRNQVFDTGTHIGSGNVIAGIAVSDDTDVLDNLVAGVVGIDGPGAYAMGIAHTLGAAGVIAGNRVRGLVRSIGGVEIGIYAASYNTIIRDNSVTRAQGAATAIACINSTSTAYRNVTSGTGSTVLAGCDDAGGNTTP